MRKGKMRKLPFICVIFLLSGIAACIGSYIDDGEGGCPLQGSCSPFEFTLTITVNYAGQDGKTVFAELVPQTFQPFWAFPGGGGVLSGGTITFNMRPVIVGNYRLFLALDVDDNWSGEPGAADLMAGPIPVVLAQNQQLTVEESAFKPINVTITINHIGVDGHTVYLTVVTDGQPCDSSPVAEDFKIISTSTANLIFWGVPDGTYDVCALIDMDGSGSDPTPGDRYAQGINLVIPPGTATINEIDFTAI